MPKRDCALSRPAEEAGLGCRAGLRALAELCSAAQPGAALHTCSVLARHGTSCLCFSKYRLLRSAQRNVSSIDALARAPCAGNSVHSSKAITMSAPRPIWVSIALSGLKKCDEPSRWERKVTPCSLILRRSFRLKTWNPPESVKIERGHDMKRCSPPSLRTVSTPGRKYR